MSALPSLDASLAAWRATQAKEREGVYAVMLVVMEGCGRRGVSAGQLALIAAMNVLSDAAGDVTTQPHSMPENPLTGRRCPP